MKEEERKTRNELKLKELYFSFREKIQGVLKILENSGLRPRIQEAWRSSQEQERLYRSGYSTKAFRVS